MPEEKRWGEGVGVTQGESVHQVLCLKVSFLFPEGGDFSGGMRGESR